MGNRYQAKLSKIYRQYRSRKRKRNLLGVLRTLMPEIIFRTTKLEGEPVTRKLVRGLFQ